MVLFIGYDGGMRKVLTTLSLAVLMLVVIGLVSVTSSSSVRSLARYGSAYHFMYRQAISCALGMICCFGAAHIDYHIWRRREWQIALLSVALLSLILVLIPGIGEMVNGSRRWIRLPGIPFQVQPSEFVKIATVLLTAAWMDMIGWRSKRFVKGFFIPVMVLGVFVLLLMREPDFGATFVTGILAFSIFFAAGVRLVYLIGSAFAAGLGFAVLILRDPVRSARMFAWSSGPDGGGNAAYQVKQSILAFVNGGVSGVGLNNSIQKHFYLPEAHTDFIFAIVGEEFGMVGTMAVVLLFVVILICGIWIAFKAPDRLGRLIAFGLTLMLVFQAAFNVGVVIGALPTKGLALPFISYGGTNMLTALISIGILINIGRHIEEVEYDAHAQMVRNAAKRI